VAAYVETRGRKLLFLAKAISALWLASSLVLVMLSSVSVTADINYFSGTAFTTVVLSLGSLQTPQNCYLFVRHDYSPLPEGSIENLVERIAFFYVLMLCQGSLYIMASILGPFSFFPRRSLVRQLRFSSQRGAKAIDLYYQYAYATCMEGGTTSLANFAIKSLNSSSSTSEIQIIGVLLLDSLLHESDSSDKLMSNIIHSEEALSKVFGMLGRSDARGGDIRLFAARVTAKLSSRINYALIPGTVKLFSSLLDSENQPQIASGNSANSGCSQPRDDLLEHGESNIGCSWVCRRWQPTKDKWSIPGEPPLTPEDSLPVLGLVILEKLDWYCLSQKEILEVPSLISKAIRLLSYTTDNKGSKKEGQQALISSSLNLLRRLATTCGITGVKLRQELWKNNLLLLSNLTRILKDSHSSPKVWEPVMDIIAKLAMDERAGCEIGGIQVVMENIMSAKGKHLESLIGLASQICGVIPYSFVHELKSHTNGDVLVQNLLRTLNANWIPDHQYPRMRRVIVEAVISIVESCPRYATLFRRAGMIKALHEVQRWTPFETEKYRAFCEGTGVILQSGPPLSALVERAERLIYILLQLQLQIHEINEAAPMDDRLPHPSSKA
ncbi:hypothetical protein EJB05_17847, partial [Eragrostis curvula]